MTTATQPLTYASKATFREIPLKSVIVDPTKNYRWGSDAAMREDMARIDRTADGETINLYGMLKESIRAVGVEEPIGVVAEDDKFTVIYGFTRAMAAREVGLKVVPAAVYTRISEAEIVERQMRENSLTLKRGVHWLAEAESFARLVEKRVPEYTERAKAGEKFGMSARLKDKPMPPREAAIRDISTVLGVEPGTMHNRIAIAKLLPESARAFIKEAAIGFFPSKEFHSGDKENPYTDEFIKAVIADIRKFDPSAARITPKVIRNAKHRVLTGGKKESAAKKLQAFAKGEMPDTLTAKALILDANRLSPGALRDHSADLATTYMLREGVTLSSDKATWDAVRTSPEWSMILGLGCGAGDVPLPSTVAADSATDPAAASRVTQTSGHVELGYRYVVAAFAYAALRLEVLRRKRGDFGHWLAGSSMAGAAKKSNRMEFTRAIREAVQESTHKTPVRKAVESAWHGLLASQIVG
jgi:hypothetical protein